jgi:hypothetical protein
LDGLLESQPDGCTRPVFRVASAIDAAWWDTVAAHARAVVVFGPGALAADVTASLDALAQHAPHTVCASIVLTTDDRLAEFQELIDADRIFYLSRGELSERDLDALIESALQEKPPHVSLDDYLSADSLRRLALAQSVAELAAALRTAITKAVDAERSRCIFYDSDRHALWIPNESEGESSAVGLVSFIFRTGSAVCLSRLGDDARFDHDLDNPDGDAFDRFLGVPVRTGGGAVMAVLVAVRPASERPFEPLEIAALEAVAAHASPYVAAWLVDADESESPFRRNALRELDAPITAGPEPLRLDPRWTRRASSLAVAALIAALLALVFVRVPQYATGNAVVRNDGTVIATFPANTNIDRDTLLRFNHQSLPIESIDVRDAQTIVIARSPRAQIGSRGKAEVHVQSERLLFVLAPALKGSRNG